jgi:hypothetical protein
MTAIWLYPELFQSIHHQYNDFKCYLNASSHLRVRVYVDAIRPTNTLDASKLQVFPS